MVVGGQSTPRKPPVGINQEMRKDKPKGRLAKRMAFYAINRRKQLLQQRGTRIHRDLTERLRWFTDRYQILTAFAFEPGCARVYLGDKAQQICRFCGGNGSQVKFKKLAHAIPDQVGNDWLFDHEECDTCNAHFAKWVENDFGKWTHPWRTLGRIKGKDGVPSIKSNDKQFRIDANVTSTDAETGAGAVRHGLKIVMTANDHRHELNESNRTVKLTVDCPAYVPMGVFKCLVKMALSVMPAEEEQKCAHLKKWILLTEHSYESYRYRPLVVHHQFAPGPLPNDKIACLLMRRTATADDCPYMQFVLQLSNHVFQIALPMHIEDRADSDGKKLELCRWSNTWADVEHQLQYGSPEYQAFDMSGTSLIRGESRSMVFSYDELIDLPSTTGKADVESQAD